jgi:hypothetical protein
MASSGKKKTTMAKITRENRVRERRMEKQAKKDARKRESAEQPGLPDTADTAADEPMTEPAPPEDSSVPAASS